MNKEAYKNLIAGDIEWLKKQSHSLEKDHILCILDASPDVYYPKKKSILASPNDEQISISLPLSVSLDDIRSQLSTVICAQARLILSEHDIRRLDGVVDLLDDILEKATHAKQQRVHHDQ